MPEWTRGRSMRHGAALVTAAARASAKRSTWRKVRVRSKAASSWAASSVTSGSASRTAAEGAPLRPGQAGVALDDAVGLVAGQPGRDQRQQHGLGEDETERALGEVLERPLRVDDQAGGQARRLAQHVAGQHGGVGQRHPLDRAVRDVALVPQRHVLEPGAEVAAQQRGPARTAARRGSGCACAAWPSCPSARRRRAPPPRPARSGPGGGSRCTSARWSRRWPRRRRGTRRGDRGR